MNVRRIKAIQGSKGDESYINLRQDHWGYSNAFSSRRKYRLWMKEPEDYVAIWHLLKNLRWNPDLASLLMVYIVSGFSEDYRAPICCFKSIRYRQSE